MCGIFCYLGVTIGGNLLKQEYMKTYGRGPDSNIIKQICHNLVFGFHRLSIMDTSFSGDQPLYHPNKPYILICNGEIYNYQQLKEKYNIQTYSNSDCEVILYLYEKFGIEKTLRLLDSEAYAFCLYDGLQNKLIVARDRFGVRPLFIGQVNKDEYIFCSEMKSIYSLLNFESGDTIEQFRPGSYRIFNLKEEYSFWSNMTLIPTAIMSDTETDYINYYYKNYQITKQYNEEVICDKIRYYMTQAVKKRLMSDRPIGCLLSGGLDSSLISSLVSREFKNSGKGELQTFAIGIKGATDLEYAKQVANYIGSKHHSIELEEKDFVEAIPNVIKAIESYDTTTVRASTGNYLVGKYIKENTDITVVFNGDGSDEQSGYLYLSKAPDKRSFHLECQKLLNEIHYFDVLRSDRSLSTDWSLETRSPFLDTDFVNYYMSIPTELKMYGDNKIEKYLLRKAFDKEELLPKEVLWRRKEAFSDGCSSNQRSWHKIIQEFVDTQITDEEFLQHKDDYKHNTPQLKESYYYRKIFEEYYPNAGSVIPHFWLPKWNGNQIDPSARELNGYQPCDTE